MARILREEAEEEEAVELEIFKRRPIASRGSSQSRFPSDDLGSLNQSITIAEFAINIGRDESFG